MIFQRRPSIAVILPSRGQLFAGTMIALLRELEGTNHRIFWSNGNPIPDCFNKPLEEALRGKFSHIWFVEEDMYLYDNVLQDLLDANEDAVACDYPVSTRKEAKGQKSGSVLYATQDTGYFSGTGCLLVKREIFDELPKPIFRSDIEWIFRPTGQGFNFLAQDFVPNDANHHPYGLHDITFGLMLYMRGHPIRILEKNVDQYRLVRKGKSGTNEGAHTIALMDNFKRIDLTDYWAGQPVTGKEDMVMEVELDGHDVFIERNRALELIKEGKVRRNVVIGPLISLDFHKRQDVLEDFVCDY